DGDLSATISDKDELDKITPALKQTIQSIS
ncbi:MAG: hypothetical protein PWR12_1687, partial [Eubacteriaceae bacterium]|nr:hypothetical protein [Eubacteriaceae bacterium]